MEFISLSSITEKPSAWEDLDKKERKIMKEPNRISRIIGKHSRKKYII